MRRSLSLVLVAAMLLSMVIFAVPSASAATKTEPKLDWGNSYATAYYYGGMVNYYEVKGKTVAAAAPSTEVTDEVNYRKEPTTDDLIKLDGTIEEGEWGKPSLSVSSKDAAQFSGTNGKQNPDFDNPSKQNTFYMKNVNAPKDLKYYDMQFDAYFLWDEQYFYLAVDALDYDGHHNAKATDKEGAWDGDAIQFRIDPDGPNSIVDGQGYDAKVDPYPWNRQVAKGWEETYSEFPNFIIALTKPKDKSVNGSTDVYVERWDAARRYDVTEEAPSEPDGDPTLKGSQANVAQGVDDSTRNFSWGPVYASVMTKSEKDDEHRFATRTQYEVAIPWEYMDSASDIIASEEYFTPKAGMELGMALSLLNSPYGSSAGYVSYLEWGNGVARDASYQQYEVAGGSNCLVLDDTPFREADICTHETFTPPTCEEGYKCTKCGYEKGFPLGHLFTYSEATPATPDAEGSILGTCMREGCNYWIKQRIPKTKYEEAAAFRETDTGLTVMPSQFDASTTESEKSGWTKMWVNEDGTPYKDDNGKTRNAYEVLNGEAVANLTMLKYTGTAFYGQTQKDMLSFSQSMDIYMTGYSYKEKEEEKENKEETVKKNDNTNNMAGEDGYTTGIYTTFGGNENVGFNAGLYYIPSDDQYYFAIIRTNRGDDTNKIHSAEKFEKEAYVYKKVDKAEAESFMNQWHNLKVVYDETTQTAFVYWDNELMVSAFSTLRKHCKSPLRDGKKYDSSYSPVMRTFDVQFYAKNVIWERLTPGEALPPIDNRPPIEGEEFKATINGVEYKYTAGEQVKLTADAFYEEKGWGYRFDTWTGDVATVADVNSNDTTFTMPEQNVTIESKYYLIGDADGDNALTSTDALYITRMVGGNMPETKAADITGDGVVTANDAVYMKRYLVGNYVPTK